VASGIVSALIGASGKSAATDQKAVKTRVPVNLILAIATPLFLIILAIGVSVLMDYVLLGHPLLESPLIGGDAETARSRWEWRWLWIGIAVIAVVAAFAWSHVNINRFSIHALYRNRLIRAYLGASNPARTPNPFTGFDDNDNIKVAMLWPGRPGSWQPLHLVNMAPRLLETVARPKHGGQGGRVEPACLAGGQGGIVHHHATALRNGSGKRWRTARPSSLTRVREPSAQIRRADPRWRHHPWHRAGDLGGGGEPEHGLQLVADSHPAAGAVQRAPGEVAGKSRHA